MQHSFLEGHTFLIDKPYGITSFGVVKKLRYHLCKKLGIKKLKVGHAGTLDPLATGLLIVLTGKKTKEIPSFMGLDKNYTGTIKLGATTPCYDREMPEENHKPVPDFSREDLEKIALQLTGDIEQMPPVYSAIKKDGAKLYSSARKGIEITNIQPRPVLIHHFLITKIDLPFVHFDILCSKGTYIRSIAHDFGRLATCGAHLYDLRRTAIGTHHIDQATSMEDALEYIQNDTF